MKQVTAHQTTDGQLFINPSKAELHQKDLIWQALDDILPKGSEGLITEVSIFNGFIPEIDRSNIIQATMLDPHLISKVRKLAQALDLL